MSYRTVKNRIQPGDGDPRHGTHSGYTNHKCRCGACCAANTAYHIEKRRTDPFWRERHNRQKQESLQRARQVSA